MTKTRKLTLLLTMTMKPPPPINLTLLLLPLMMMLLWTTQTVPVTVISLPTLWPYNHNLSLHLLAYKDREQFLHPKDNLHHSLHLDLYLLPGTEDPPHFHLDLHLNLLPGPEDPCLKHRLYLRQHLSKASVEKEKIQTSKHQQFVMAVKKIKKRKYQTKSV